MLQMTNITSIIMQSYLVNLYQLQLGLCRIIHAKLINEIKIKEQIDLIKKELRAIDNEGRDKFLPIILELLTSQVKLMLNKNIKSILFEYCTIIENKEAYKKINMQSKEYLQKINLGILEEGYVLCERMLELIDEFLEEYGPQI